MDKSNKTRNYDQDKKIEKKMVVKFVGGSGGGIGAFILLGGVLATAALASAFAARRKDRRSPPQKDEQDEANNDTVSLVSTEVLEPDVKMINGVSDEGFVMVYGNKMGDDEEAGGDVSDDYSKQEENQDQSVYIEEEPKQVKIGIIEEDKDVEEEREGGLKENLERGFCSGDEEMMSEGRESGEIGAEKLVKKQEKCEEEQRNETRGKIEEREENVSIPHEKSNQENGCILVGIVNGEAEFDAKEKGVDVSPKTNDIDKAKDDMNLEESSLGSGDSAAIWPPKVIDFEVSEQDDQTIIDKYFTVEMGMKKDGRASSDRRRVATSTFLLLSSLFFAWFFALPLAHLCLLLFLTMFLSEIYCY